MTTAALVEEATGRPEDFSNNLTGLLYTGPDGNPAVLDLPPAPSRHVLATADPPDHTAHRRLLQPLFSPGSIRGLQPRVTEIAHGLVDTLVANPHGDLVTTVAEPLPVTAICWLIGIPNRDIPMLLSPILQSNDLLAGVVDTAAMAQGHQSAAQVRQYLTELLTSWPAGGTGRPTVCGVLDQALAEGEITTETAIGMLVQLLGAGTDTTTALISRTVLALASDADLQQRVRNDLELLPSVIEETLRIDGPFRFHYRAVPKDTQLGGVDIPEGSRLMLSWGSANLDDQESDASAETDAQRKRRAHFAFGKGIHFCIGAPLARLEARIAIARLLETTQWFTLEPDAVPIYHRTIFMRRLAQLRLEITPIDASP